MQFQPAPDCALCMMIQLLPGFALCVMHQSLPMLQFWVDHSNGLVAEAGCHAGALPVPAYFKDAAGPSESSHESSSLDGPDVELFIEGPAG